MLPLPRKSTPKRIWVWIQIDNIWTSNSDFGTRYSLEDQVQERGIGKLSGSGSGGGWMDFDFIVENIDQSLNAFVALLTEAGQLNHSEIEVLRDYSNEESERGDRYDCQDDDEDFQPGSALTFRYADGDYGAGLIVMLAPDHGEYPQYKRPLLGVLDYKSSEPPTKSIFERHQWLITTCAWNHGEPYFAWMSRCGVNLFLKIDQIDISEIDIKRCQFYLDWELLAEMVEIERQR